MPPPNPLRASPIPPPGLPQPTSGPPPYPLLKEGAFKLERSLPSPQREGRSGEANQAAGATNERPLKDSGARIRFPEGAPAVLHRHPGSSARSRADFPIPLYWKIGSPQSPKIPDHPFAHGPVPADPAEHVLVHPPLQPSTAGDNRSQQCRMPGHAGDGISSHSIALRATPAKAALQRGSYFCAVLPRFASIPAWHRNEDRV